MVQFVLLILGIVYAFRKPKIKALNASDFPNVQTDRFEEWKALEIKGINAFLWATWGVFLISTPFMVILEVYYPGKSLLFSLAIVVLFLIAIILATRQRDKATKLKKELGIQWPKK